MSLSNEIQELNAWVAALDKKILEYENRIEELEGELEDERELNYDLKAAASSTAAPAISAPTIAVSQAETYIPAEIAHTIKYGGAFIINDCSITREGHLISSKYICRPCCLIARKSNFALTVYYNKVYAQYNHAEHTTRATCKMSDPECMEWTKPEKLNNVIGRECGAGMYSWMHGDVVALGHTVYIDNAQLDLFPNKCPILLSPKMQELVGAKRIMCILQDKQLTIMYLKGIDKVETLICINEHCLVVSGGAIKYVAI